jgi:hypothetical protein
MQQQMQQGPSIGVSVSTPPPPSPPSPPLGLSLPLPPTASSDSALDGDDDVAESSFIATEEERRLIINEDDVEAQTQTNLTLAAGRMGAGAGLQFSNVHSSVPEDGGVGTLWCNNGDGCGLVCVGFTYFLLAWPGYILWGRVLSPWTSLWTSSSLWSGWQAWLLFAVYLLLASLAALSHWRAMTTDPGSIPYGCLPLLDAPPPQTAGCASSSVAKEKAVYPSCERCAFNYKPPRAHHCSICKRCISKMDHRTSPMPFRPTQKLATSDGDMT